MADAWEDLAARYKTDAPKESAGDAWSQLADKYKPAEEPQANNAEPKEPPKQLKIGKEGFSDALASALKDSGWLERNIAGAGTALSSLYYGGRQVLGGAYDNMRAPTLSELVTGKQSTFDDSDAIAANRQISQSAPVGSFVGNAALVAPTMMIPGANTVAGSSAAGALIGALQPTVGNESRALNAALGGALGGAGQGVANAIGGKLAANLASRQSELAAQQSKNLPIDTTIKEALDAGYVIPPGQVNPSFWNRTLESVGGKIATQQMASNRNQQVTDALARRAAGLAEDAPIMPESLKAVRTELGKAYDEVAKIVGPDTVEALKTARADANQLWNMQNRNPHPETLKLAKEATDKAANLEKSIDQVLKSVGQKDVMQSFRDARKNIAINHAVENALIEGGGTVDARAIARLAQRGEPLSGDLATIGNFANNFPKIAQPEKVTGTPDAHNLKTLASILMGSGGGAAMGPAGIALGALPLITGPMARAAMFRQGAQQALVPNYSAGAVRGLLGNYGGDAAAIGLRGAVPAGLLAAQ